MINIDTNTINGYIEGYYGKLLSWQQRRRILTELNKLKFNSYFYCPKEDVEHRYDWKKKYSNKWLKNFKNFCFQGKTLNIDILAGLSPGLDYNFNQDTKDFNILFSKASELIKNGASIIVLMFDDIPDNFYLKYPLYPSEGKSHAELTNKLSLKLKAPVFLVPRVYADELINESNDYIPDISKYLNDSIPIFYCGKKIVADNNLLRQCDSLKGFSNKVIFWDNLYANDYCPRKLFIGPWLNRSCEISTLVNLTGMIETDILLLNFIRLSINNNQENNWDIILKKFNIPLCFKIILDYFSTPNKYINKNYFKNYINQIDACDFMLWKWKTPLSREWYPFLFGLKHDLQLLHDKLTCERIHKTQTEPLSFLIKKK